MKGKLRIIAIIALIVGILLGGSGLLGESGGAIIGLCSLTIAINWLMLYAATRGKPKGKQKVLAILSKLQWSIPICALFWWALGSIVWPDNTTLRAVSFSLALPCLLMMSVRKRLFSIDGHIFHIKLPGLHPTIVTIIIIGMIIGGTFIGLRSCVKNASEKEYLEALEYIEVEACDKYFNDSTNKFDFLISLKNGTPYTVTRMRFSMKVYDKTGTQLVDTSFYIPEGAVLATEEEQSFYVYVKQSDVECVETLYYSDLTSLSVQVWITEVEYEEYGAPLDTEHQCYSKPAIP